VVIMVFTTSGVTSVVVVSTAEESVLVGSLVPSPPQEVKNNTMAAQNSKPVNLDFFIDFGFNN
jgi:hypothetical protein